MNAAERAALDQEIANNNDLLDEIVRRVVKAQETADHAQVVADLAVTLFDAYDPLDVAALTAAAIARLARGGAA